MNPIDVVMFAMDRQMDRRIVLAAETLMGAGYTVRVFAPADGAPQTEPAWIGAGRLYRAGDATVARAGDP